jgi:hypothetical protein
MWKRARSPLFESPEHTFENTTLRVSQRLRAAKFEGGRRNMNARILLGLVASVAVGAAITLISGLIQTPMGHLGVDVVYWGIPLPWTMRVIPTRFQSIDWLNLIADLVFWVIIASVISTTLVYLGTRRTINQSASAPHPE